VQETLAATARRQGGVFTRAQARACGYSDRRIRTELSTGRWFVVTPGVYRLAGAPGGWVTRVWAALLGAGEGALLGGRPAGRVHRLDGVPAYDRIEVVVPQRRRVRRAMPARVEHAPVDRIDVTRRSGIPILSAERTVVDLARREPLDVGAHIVGDALRTGTVNPDALAGRLAAARGRVGAARARAAVALADPRLESLLERQLAVLIAAAGVPVVPQLDVVRGGLFLARLDFGNADLRLAIEADGYAAHSRRHAFERDRERHNLLQLAGWTTLSFTAAQIRGRSALVRATIERMAGTLAAQRATAWRDTAGRDPWTAGGNPAIADVRCR
jgi:hypothetical protein